MKPTPLIVFILVALSARQSASKYTTLLEDEQDSGQGQPSSPDKSKPSAAVSYGKLIYERPDDQSQRSAGPNNVAPPTATSTNTPNTTSHTSGKGNQTACDSSVFSRIYSKVSAYLPFLTQLAILRQPGASNNRTVNDSEPHARTNVSVSMVRDMIRPADRNSNRDVGQQATGGANSDGGQSSNSNDISNKGKDNSYGSTNGEANQDNQQTLNDDKQESKVNVIIDRKRVNDFDDGETQNGNHSDQTDDAAATYNSPSGQFGKPIDNIGVSSTGELDEQEPSIGFKSGGLKRNQQYLVEDNGRTDARDVDMDQMLRAPLDLGNLQDYWNQADSNDQQDQHAIDPNTRYNMMRQSNLVMPMAAMSSAEDMLTSTTTGAQKPISRPPESLLGRYIYAPTQHYYLNSVMPPQVSPGAVVQQQHVMKPLQPGDQIYSSYAPGTPVKAAAYTYQKEPNSLGDKPNDLYFLVMVGAFCMMATTVVLAAGLFAYRIQQNRKSSQDTDYPTYGVVGPNNISGKCGAASLVSGYFMGPPGSGTSKSGSVRHLADLYGNVSSGTGGSDSGLNSLDKSSNKKASSSSSLNEFQQPPSGRATSNNFMTAAASQDAARMYHYQHQKQQMIISDRNSGRQTTASDLDSEDENDDGSYTVYECPGLAPAHEMEIKNPLFTDDQSP